MIIKLIWAFFLISLISVGNGIFRGQYAPLEEFPHQVSIRWNSVHICSGSIISNYHILGSASCATLMSRGPYSIFLANLQILCGLHDQNDITGQALLHNVSRIIVHRRFNHKNFFANDIALFRLETPIIFSAVSNKVEISSSKLDKPSGKRWLTSWGSANRELIEFPISRYLQKLESIILENKRCQTYYPKFNKKQYCIFTRPLFSSATKGDGGSPITSDGKIIGVLSVLPEHQNLPIIITDVWSYKKFISNLMTLY